MRRVMMFGTFDILHRGHIEVFRQARELGDELIVVVARDKNVEALKSRRAHHTEQERKEVLEHIDLIDKVVLGSDKDSYAVIAKYNPDIIALGYDQIYFVDGLEDFLEKHKLKTEIIRLHAYEPDRCKSSILQQKYTD